MHAHGGELTLGHGGHEFQVRAVEVKTVEHSEGQAGQQLLTHAARAPEETSATSVYFESQEEAF